METLRSLPWGHINGVVTAVSILVFFGIVAWSWSSGRSKANEEASMLPFDLPDEIETQKKGVEK